MLKLDINKSFDTVDWAFLMEVMQQFGFGPKWIAWVDDLLASSSTRVLLNGILGEIIYNRQGLRQGDPISPLLFLMVMEGLHHLLQRAAIDGVMAPLTHAGLRHMTSIYADDVVIWYTHSLA